MPLIFSIFQRKPLIYQPEFCVLRLFTEFSQVKSFYLAWCRKMPFTVSFSVQDVVTVNVSDVFIEESLTTAKPSARNHVDGA